MAARQTAMPFDRTTAIRWVSSDLDRQLAKHRDFGGFVGRRRILHLHLRQNPNPAFTIFQRATARQTFCRKKVQDSAAEMASSDFAAIPFRLPFLYRGGSAAERPCPYIMQLELCSAFASRPISLLSSRLLFRFHSSFEKIKLKNPRQFPFFFMLLLDCVPPNSSIRPTGSARRRRRARRWRA